MPRHHGRRHQGIPPLPLPASGYRCLGCPEPVSRSRLCCPRCWGRLPLALRQELTVPEGVWPHEMTGFVFETAKANAAEWLTKDRETVT